MHGSIGYQGSGARWLSHWRSRWSSPFWQLLSSRIKRCALRALSVGHWNN